MTRDDLQPLRDALALTPENAPLRRHLASGLLERGLHPEAEQVLRDGLRQAPRDAEAKLLLARCYRAQGKHSAAHVVLEDMIREGAEEGRARIEQVRTFLSEGNIPDAVRQYERALQDDPELADAELGERLGVEPGRSEELGTSDELSAGRLRAFSEGAPAGPQIEPLRPDVSFSDVGGMESLKEEIRRKAILPITHPELFEAYGKKAGGGILLYGPPGCGKTHLARATAGEVAASFLSIGIHDVLDMWIGQSERNLHEVFEQARRHKPCVLFFDEADALGASRSDFRTSAGRQTINQFLSELDGVQADNDGLLVLAATNAPWQMDPAFRRPGRFDEIIFVPPPDAEARAEIVRILLAGKPQEDVDHAAIARKTKDFSGADLQAVVDGAISAKLDQAVKTGRPEPLRTKDLVAAAKRRKPTTREWFRTVRNYVLYANDDGLYDEIKPYLD